MSDSARYDDILVATDGGPLAQAATQHALELASAFDARIHALAVVNTSIAGDYPSKRAAASDAVAAVANDADETGVDLATAIREGTRPYAEIVDYQESNDVGLVAMGTHGRSGVRRYLLGSVAERVVRTTCVPVLAVPPAEAEVREPTYESVLLPVDDSDVARRAARHGVGIAEPFDAAVHTLHAAAASADEASESKTEADGDPVDQTLTGVTERARASELEAVDHRYGGNPVDAIAESIGEHEVDLVAMGTQGEAGVRRLVLGGTVERVLRNVHVPVLAVPPADR